MFSVVVGTPCLPGERGKEWWRFREAEGRMVEVGGSGEGREGDRRKSMREVGGG